MNNEKYLESELIRFQTSYIELLHHTSIEIEKLKLIIQILICVDKQKPIPSYIHHQLSVNSHRLQSITNTKTIEPTLELNLYHQAQQIVDQESYKQQIEILRDSKLTLIKSSSFEIDRLRKIIKYLTTKISTTIPNAPTNFSTNEFSASQIITFTAPLNNTSIDKYPVQNATTDNSHNKTYTWNEIKQHNFEDDLWLVHDNKIYDITKFLKFHPGGPDVILQIVSKNQDITDALQTLNHPPIAEKIMVKHYIGAVANTDVNKTHKKANLSWMKPIWNKAKGNLAQNVIDNDMEKVLNVDESLLIKWDQSTFTVKIDILDKQHENLVIIINRLYNRYELKDIMELLHRWDVHCKTEETLFFYYHFDEKEVREHILDHKRIYHKIKDQITDLRIKYDNEKPRCDELIKFVKMFSEMFVNHHSVFDSKYIDHLEQ